MNEDNDTREVGLEFSVTAMMPRWWFDAAEEDGVDIYEAIKQRIGDEGFVRMLIDGTFTSIDATNTGVWFRD